MYNRSSLNKSCSSSSTYRTQQSYTNPSSHNYPIHNAQSVRPLLNTNAGGPSASQIRPPISAHSLNTDLILQSPSARKQHLAGVLPKLDEGRAMISRIDEGKAPFFEVLLVAHQAFLSASENEAVTKDLMTESPFRVSINPRKLAEGFDKNGVVDQLRQRQLHQDVLGSITRDKALNHLKVTRESYQYALTLMNQLNACSRAPQIATLADGFPQEAMAQVYSTGGYARTKNYSQANDVDFKVILDGFQTAGFEPFNSPENIQRLKTIVGKWLVDSIAPDPLIKEPLELNGYEGAFDLLTYSTRFDEGLCKFSISRINNEHSKTIDIAIVRPLTVDMSFDCIANATSLHLNSP